ncbi:MULTISPECIES: F0F1 ATP synthase subunit B [Mesorhizobium]|jgi:F-type H+-transporting ATPase subunit b|uniref:F0F1 ATP synthase subunit B n=2 Tax=Phyllobacteriaceae TaxID=69277 RepID=UPI000FCBFAEC|nr:MULTISPECIES: F0F1 ATP synthase subunit B [Mesorhizobium]MCF6122692.1 F0F1 ATP synthase subunit B [Mesorhizobium ciceri]MCQ8813156.1 F0F1 ATP synthase subunit B [Mesorhizobium sp. SEMIA396]MCQ8871352.1 F0F1 ATP synthase subunit B [Mesorhizobium sp. LMG17149]RUT84075.1 F0F1 ATP synthase subunit B [Mesorhizobium sp. M7A.T.Ca.US.000.02.1.1]RUT93687.1 F0F1 ATP synthase subunit B [Mesorhizobium sp. M7A.T.Ca.US.000.02.2.1]
MFVTSAFAQESAPSADTSHAATEGDTHSSTGVPAEAHGTFPPFDPATFPSQLLWLAITFGLFYLFLKRVVMPRVGGIIDVRNDRITQDLDQAAKLKGEADAAVAAYEQELAEAKTKANAIGQQANDAAKAEADTARKKVEAALDAKLGEAEARISSIKANAMKEVGSIAEDTASAIVEALVGGKASKAEIAAAVKSVAR